jgi:hypothetical protein
MPAFSQRCLPPSPPALSSMPIFCMRHTQRCGASAFCKEDAEVRSAHRRCCLLRRRAGVRRKTPPAQPHPFSHSHAAAMSPATAPLPSPPTPARISCAMLPPYAIFTACRHAHPQRRLFFSDALLPFMSSCSERRCQLSQLLSDRSVLKERFHH